jgi:chromosome segregation ATPase
MGAARLVAAIGAGDPERRKYIIDVAAFEARIRERDAKIKEQADKFAIDLAESRRNLTSQLVAMQRELTASRSEVANLKMANADLQQKLQDQDAVIAGLRSANADFAKKVEGYGNIVSFLGKIASGEASQ